VASDKLKGNSDLGSGSKMSKILMERFCVVGDISRSRSSLTRTLVSQFTLLASTKKGTKPDFHGALGGEEAKELYQYASLYTSLSHGSSIRFELFER
jgi:hypothetical protein